MTAGLVLGLWMQAGGWQAAPAQPTVGDTVLLTREIPAMAGARARPRPLEASELLEPLSEPEVGTRDGRIIVRYAVALFRPGRHRLPMPSVEVIHPDGVLETLVGDTAVVNVAAMLPPDSTPPPRASLAPVSRPAQRIAPFVVFVTSVLVASGAWLMVRRRRGTRPAPAPVPDEPVAVDLLHWLRAGEGRAAASYAMERVRGQVGRLVPTVDRSLSTDECLAALERDQPDWPLRDLGDLLRELDRARFAPLAPADAGELVDRAETMLVRLAEIQGDEKGDRE